MRKPTTYRLVRARWSPPPATRAGSSLRDTRLGADESRGATGPRAADVVHSLALHGPENGLSPLVPHRDRIDAEPRSREQCGHASIDRRGAEIPAGIPRCRRTQACTYALHREWSPKACAAPSLRLSRAIRRRSVERDSMIRRLGRPTPADRLMGTSQPRLRCAWLLHEDQTRCQSSASPGWYPSVFRSYGNVSVDQTASSCSVQSNPNTDCIWNCVLTYTIVDAIHQDPRGCMQVPRLPHRTPSLRRKPLWWFSAATPQRQAPTTPSHRGRLPGDATLGEDLLQVPTGRAFFPAHGGADLAEAVSSGQYHRKGTLRGRGHPDGNDADRLADDPMHKLLVVRDPVTGRSLMSQPTLSRFYGVGRTALYRLGREQAVRVIGAASAPTARSGAVTTITWTRPTTPRTARRSCPSSTATTAGGATCRCWRS